MQNLNPGVNESVEGEDIITHLIETARGLVGHDPVQSKDFFEKALTLSRNISFNHGIGECLAELARISNHQQDYDQALEKYQEAVTYFLKAHDWQKSIESDNEIAEIHFKRGNYEQATSALHRALAQAEKISGNAAVITVLNKLGDISRITGDFDSALQYHKKALSTVVGSSNDELESVTCYHIGNCLNWTNHFDEAYEYLDRSLILAEQTKKPDLLVKPTGSMAILLTKIKEHDRAETFFFKALSLLNSSADIQLKADLLKNLGQLYISTTRYEEAIKVLENSLLLIDQISTKYPSHLIHKLLSEAYEKMGDPVNALNHFKLHSSLANDFLNEEMAVKTRSLQFRFDLDQARNEKEVAQKAVALKDQFILNLSHEIRTPLNGVLGMVNLLADTNPSPEQLEYINTIRLSANNLIETIDNILDYSKIQKGEIRLENREFRIKELIASLVQSMKVKADEKNISLSLRIEESVPEKVTGDINRLSQILTNLISNSIKFTDKGSIAIDVRITEVSAQNVKILFTITDTGVGISEERLPRIYDSYAIFNEQSGAGLGLAIVKQLVDLQSGTISVNSVQGWGTVFKVELPFGLTEEVKKSDSGAAIPGNIKLKDLSDVVILLVEDNKVNQFLAQKLLGKMGFKVEIANNGREAIELLNKNIYDVILMDVQMPEMNGYELTQYIRSQMKPPVNNIPVIALTAYASVQEKEKAMSMGMSDYITKPYSPHELLAAVMKQVQSSNSSESESSVTMEMIRQSSEKLINLFSGHTEDVLSLFQMLSGQLPVLLEETAAFIKDKNWASTFHAIHRLKSSVNLLKIASLRDRISELEEWTRDEIHTDRIIPVFDSFRKECEQALGYLKEEMIRLKKLQG